MSNPQDPKPRWYRLTPDRLLLALLPIVGILWLSDHFRWFPLNEHKNWTVLIAVAAVCLTVLLLLVWFSIGLVSRLRFQFSIRSMLVFVAVVAVVCSWFSVRMQQAEKQRATAEEIEKGEGGVTYDYELDSFGNFAFSTSPSAPAWLRDLLGDDFFAEIVQVSFSEPVYFSKGNFNWEGINELQDPPIDAELERIKHLPKVQVVNLHNSVVTDAGLKHIGDLTQLVELHISYTHITDAGLQHIEGLTQLQELYLDNNRITDAGLGHIKRLRQLKKLGLSNTSVADSGIENLKGLSRLQLLDLCGTEVTDAGLELLPRRHPQLQALSLSDSKVTKAGISRFQRALPNCTIGSKRIVGVSGGGGFF